MKILIAEDDVTSRTILNSVLKKFGYEVVACSEGNEAFEILKMDDSPDIAILDWEMPGMNGIEIIKRIRKIKADRHIYMMLLTCKKNHDQILEGLHSGADDYIIKPYDNDELRARIKVGKRMIDQQNQLLEREKLQGVLEMAGAVCHEINQPLQVVSGYIELLLEDYGEVDEISEVLSKAETGVRKIGDLTSKIMNITKYKSKDYINDVKIIDIEEASKK